MEAAPAQVRLELRPKARFDVIDVKKRISFACGDLLSQYRKALYCSHHTTAGYLEQSLCARLNHSRDALNSFIKIFQQIFPPNADYYHNKLHLRTELSNTQRYTEPPNADSHLTFISSGLRNCVTYVNRADTPVYFIDLDGIYGSDIRTRRTTVIAFNREELIEKVQLQVPFSNHAIDSINLKHPRAGLMDQIEDLVKRHQVAKGRIDIALGPSERHAGLTVNEYETLLMKHDLQEVLKNPLQFMAQKGRHMIQDPRKIPSKTLNYAKYDLVQVLNELLDAFGVSESFLERMLARVIAFPALRFLRLKRSISLLVSDPNEVGKGSIVEGTYQSPILVQWQKAEGQSRDLEVTLTRFK